MFGSGWRLCNIVMVCVADLEWDVGLYFIYICFLTCVKKHIYMK